MGAADSTVESAVVSVGSELEPATSSHSSVVSLDADSGAAISTHPLVTLASMRLRLRRVGTWRVFGSLSRETNTGSCGSRRRWGLQIARIGVPARAKRGTCHPSCTCQSGSSIGTVCSALRSWKQRLHWESAATAVRTKEPHMRQWVKASLCSGWNEGVRVRLSYRCGGSCCCCLARSVGKCEVEQLSSGSAATPLLLLKCTDTDARANHGSLVAVVLSRARFVPVPPFALDTNTPILTVRRPPYAPTACLRGPKKM
ncbi:hypothetical protein L1887_53044 [Cichorium endivia]|nr:hypothetical protein L1887_53044 [Cichorium endivia]